MKPIHTALLIWLSATLLAPSAWAHGGEDHGAPPQRLPDGSLWIPKPAQYRLGLRTIRTATQNHPQAIELNGKVQPDPNAGGRVQATQTGRIEAGPQGLPVLGQRVSKGQVLAYLRPASTSLERGNQQANLAELDAQYAMAERKLHRYKQLEGAIAQKDIDTASLERDALRQRRDAVRDSLNAAEPLLAPVSGVIASSSATLGQVSQLQSLNMAAGAASGATAGATPGAAGAGATSGAAGAAGATSAAVGGISTAALTTAAVVVGAGVAITSGNATSGTTGTR